MLVLILLNYTRFYLSHCLLISLATKAGLKANYDLASMSMYCHVPASALFEHIAGSYGMCRICFVSVLLCTNELFHMPFKIIYS